MKSSPVQRLYLLCLLVASLIAFPPVTWSQPRPATPGKAPGQSLPWMDKSMSPDQRADLVLQQMTLDEKIQLVHGIGWDTDKAACVADFNWAVGFVEGIQRLGIPGINTADSAVGVRMGARQSRYSTLLPSTLGLAASWDPEAAKLYGTVIGRELRDQGFNMSIGGGVDIAREPRNGRTWEYGGEDPILAGTMVGTMEKGLLSQRVMNDIKHYALNDQETGRSAFNMLIAKRALRESDLLAFQIAIGIAQPSAVMCSYNKVYGDWACENDYLLNQVLKKDFAFPGWVISDWGGTHSTVKAANNGLDMEQPESRYFGDNLKKSIQSGEVPQARLDDMVHRILRSMFAAGVIDYPVLPRRVVDPFRGLEEAQQIEEESIVLLKNADSILPFAASRVKSIAVIGAHADVGVISGGGSAQVDAPGGNAIDPKPGTAEWQVPIYFPSSPLKYIRKKVPASKVDYNDGADPAAAAAFAKSHDVAIVFVQQYMTEERDYPTLSLPDNQDALVSAVAAANPHTVVVLETGSTVSMPWLADVQAVLAAWFPGIGGAQAISNVLFGDVNPSGKLPISFAKTEADLPHPQIAGMDLVLKARAERRPPWQLPSIDVNYTEGAKVGYKWFAAENKQPLFPFGFGLSYTTFSYSGLKVDDKLWQVTFTVKNTGSRAGAEIAQVYAQLPPAAGESYKRLVAWQRLELAPGETKSVTLPLNQLYLSIFDEEKDAFTLLPGNYKILVGPSSIDTPHTASLLVRD